MQIADCHLHLQDKKFANDRDAVIARAVAAGTALMVCNATCQDDWHDVLHLASYYPCVVPCLGLHPWYVKTRSTDWADKLESLIQTQKVGIGEIGIDRWIEGRDEAAQDEVFRTQLALARKYDRPAMVHCLQAWGPMMDILRQQAPFEAGLLFHAYGGAIELIPELVAKNVYFSFAGSILRQKNTRAKASVTAVPLDRLLVETDAPDIVLPRRLQPDSLPDERRNEPACAAVILESIAELRGVAKEELADTVWANARRFLKDLWQP